MRFKYKYEHLPCALCSDITDTGCPYALCPHILENLPDLLRDPAFTAAVEDGDNCDTFHRSTLLFLKRQQAHTGVKAIPGAEPPIGDINRNAPPAPSAALALSATASGTAPA